MQYDPEFLRISFGSTTTISAQVVVRGRLPDSSPAAVPQGCVRGPFSELAHTLPCSIPLHDQTVMQTGDSEHIWTLVGEIPDPCYWSPGAPYWYELQWGRTARPSLPRQNTLRFGIRRFGSCGRNLFFNGRRWVARAVSASAGEEADISAWRHLHACMLIESDNEARIRAASAAGVMAIVVPGPGDEVLRACLAAWRHEPSVGMVLIRHTDLDKRQLDDLAPHTLRLQEINCEQIEHPAEWAQGLVIDATDLTEERIHQLEQLNLPLLAAVPLNNPAMDLATARSQCDALQRNLAKPMTFAGYLVT